MQTEMHMNVTTIVLQLSMVSSFLPNPHRTRNPRALSRFISIRNLNLSFALKSPRPQQGDIQTLSCRSARYHDSALAINVESKKKEIPSTTTFLETLKINTIKTDLLAPMPVFTNDTGNTIVR